MAYETLTLDIEANVATITMNRPDSGNALSPLGAKEFCEVATALESNPEVRAVVLTGAGRMFCAGGDLAAMAQAGDDRRRLLMQMAGDLHMGLSRLSRGNAPVIAAVNGTAAGAGLSMVMACDLAVAGESCVFTSAYTAAGLSPDGSSTYFMPRKIGDRRTRELMLTNRVLKGAEAVEWGIVNEVVEDGKQLERAMELARQIAAGPTLAFGAVKTLLNGTFDQTLESQMELESRAIADLSMSDDGREGIDAFLNKRKPSFKGS